MRIMGIDVYTNCLPDYMVLIFDKAMLFGMGDNNCTTDYQITFSVVG